MIKISASMIFHRGMAWHTYRNLEQDFIEVTRYVALEKENGGAYSERIAQLLLLVGSTVDSVFFEMRTSPSLDGKNGVDELRQNAEPNIGQYREVYEPIYQLSTVGVLAHHGLTNYGTIKPFDPFLPKQSPPWWNAYNDIKHEYYQNWRKGTLDNLVHALGALFALNILHKDAQYYLLQRQVILMVSGYDEKQIYNFPPLQMYRLMSKSFIGLPHDISWGASASSEVFYHYFRKDPNQEN
ncbi:MAG: hypothetical protein ABSC50_09675 [Candidatus Bathyarchaeia archaeon]